MPRNVKESDDEWEAKGGVRKTRSTLGSSVLDSPLRRSTRIKQPVAQNDSSPESTGDASLLGASKSTRRRTIGLDGAVPETGKIMRTRRNSAASDASEFAENDSLLESSAKRITRRSIAGLPSTDTPSKLRTKGRVARAGSESKSTPPVGRMTRRTRASSMEPETTDETRVHDVETPLRSRKRASALPSETAVVEESEDSRSEKMIYEVDEDEFDTSPDASELSRQSSKANTSERDEKMEVDEEPVVESEIDAMSRKSSHDLTEEGELVTGANVSKVCEDAADILDRSGSVANREEKSPRVSIIADQEKASIGVTENTHSKSAEIEETVTDNKENEASNASIDSTPENVGWAKVETRNSPRKSLDSSFSRITEDRRSLSYNDDPLEIPQDSIEVGKPERVAVARDTSLANETLAKKDAALEAECVVLIETMDVEKINAAKMDSSRASEPQQTLIHEEEEREPVEQLVEIEKNEGVAEEATAPETSTLLDAAAANDLEKPMSPVEPHKLVEPSKSTEESKQEETTNANSSSSLPSGEASVIAKTTSDQEKLEIAQSNEEERGTCDEPACPSPELRLRSPSPEKENPGEAEERATASCDTEALVVETIVAASSEVEEISPECAKDTSPTSPGSKATNRRASTDDAQSPRKIEDNQDEIIPDTLKERKSCIVTETPASGRSTEESSRLSEQAGDTEESPSAVTSDERSKAQEKDVVGLEEKCKSVENGELTRAFDSDDESESVLACPSFKDIPADEWNDPENVKEIPSPRNDAEEDSIHSYSTERNESECEIALVDKNSWQTMKSPRKNRDAGDSDSEDTVIASNDAKSKDTEVEVAADSEPCCDETPMDVSSDHFETGAQEKFNISAVLSEKPVDSSEPSKNTEVNSSRRSINGTPKRRSSAGISSQRSENSSENEETETKVTPARVSRKSLDKSITKQVKDSFVEKNSDGEVPEILSQDSRAAKNSPKKLWQFDDARKLRNSATIDEANSEEEMASPKKFNGSTKSECKRTSASNDDEDDVALDRSKGSLASASKRRYASFEECEEESRSKLSVSLKSEKRCKSRNGKDTRLHKELRSDRGSISAKDRSIAKKTASSDSEGSEDSDDADLTVQKIPRFLFEANTSSDDEDDDTEKSMDSDVANDMNLAGKSVIEYSDDDVPGDDCMITESESCDSEDDDGADLIDFVVNDDEYESEDAEEEEEEKPESGDDENESSKDRRRPREKKRKRIITRPDSDSAESENEEESEKLEDDEKAPVSEVTSRVDQDHSDTQSDVIEKRETLNESGKIPDLNESAKLSAKKQRHKLLECSTPKLTPRLDASLGKSVSAKKTVELSTSLKEAKTPASGKSLLHTSLPTDDRTVISELKTPKLTTGLKSQKSTALRRTMLEPTSDSPETRFLMKEKLNESLPPLKLQQRSRESRTSVTVEKNIEEAPEEMGEDQDMVKIVQTDLADTYKQKKKKNKKKNKKKKDEIVDPTVNGTEDDPVAAMSEESLLASNKSQEALVLEDIVKKSKKRKKKSNSESVDIVKISHEGTEETMAKRKRTKRRNEEPIVEEPVVPDFEGISCTDKKKKKKKTQRVIVEEEIVPEENVKHEEKKKKKKKVRIAEPDVTTSRKEAIPISPEIDSFASSLTTEKQRNSVQATKRSKTRDNPIGVERTEKMGQGASVGDTEVSRVKRLPDDVLESLSEIPERPKKRRKIAKDERALPSRRMFSPSRKLPSDIAVYDNFVSTSLTGGTTQFEVVDLVKATKKVKKPAAAMNFRERMLARNPRQPISAYLMYQQKQKASGRV